MRNFCLAVLAVFFNASFAWATWPGCVYSSAINYGVSARLLLAIADVESSFNACAVNKNSDGSEDLGLMQINSWWLPKLADAGVSRTDLFDPCISVATGAWILADSFMRYGHNWKAVGAYNAGTAKNDLTEQRRQIYAHKVFASLAVAVDDSWQRLRGHGSCY